MSKKEIIRKVIQIGTWVEDIISNDFMKNIVTSVAQKQGKKRKLKLSQAGLKLIQSRFLQESKSVSFPLSEIKTVTKIPEAPSCIMFVLEDKVRRFRILAFRCSSEEDATQFTSLFDYIQLDQPRAVELKKEDNGNWTLRERNAHNTGRHMADIFNARSQTNGEVKPNGVVTTHIPVLDRNKNYTISQASPEHAKSDKPRFKYSFKRNKGSKKESHDGVDYKVVKNKGDDYVIETEVSQHPHVSMTSHTTTTLEPEFGVVKETTPIEVHMRHENPFDYSGDPNHIIYGSSTNSSRRSSNILPSKPVIYATHTHSEQPVVYRANSRTYDTKPRPVTYYADPWATHRRFMGEYGAHLRPVSHHPAGSDHGSVIMRAETDSVSSKMSKRSRAMSKSEYSVKTTVERPIEATYGRRTVVVRRTEPGYMLVPIHRRSYHDVVL
ncbi:uncharacterized protein LOC106056205 [Biomphalaria glabrata]|uniref:Uncharacterized protein LOC106056205 n=1 Tax=Biomphalaria glabrata TaxID=6526 RepID=A0A9U8E1A4_BIOGL|nr:uncharacterized protein LOC106056205 [Biomphalaria glabrata]